MSSTQVRKTLVLLALSATIAGCRTETHHHYDLPASMKSPEMVEGMKVIEQYSLPIHGKKILVNGKQSLGSQWCRLPDGKYFIYLQQEDLTPEEPEGVYLLDWSEKTLELCIRSDFLISKERLYFLNYPIDSGLIREEDGKLWKGKPVLTLYKVDKADLNGIGFRILGFDVLICDPAEREPMWDKLDAFHGDHDDPRNREAYPPEWRKWADRRFNEVGIGPPPPRTKNQESSPERPK